MGLGETREMKNARGVRGRFSRNVMLRNQLFLRLARRAAEMPNAARPRAMPIAANGDS